VSTGNCGAAITAAGKTSSAASAAHRDQRATLLLNNDTGPLRT
jgi:hypothetical protein